MATTYTNSTVQAGAGGDENFTIGVSTSQFGFYGSAGVTKASLTQLATTASTTQLRAELTALQGALHNLGLITIT